MNSTLIPERPLLISPTLAATIGLEETVLLHVLSELIAMQSSGPAGAGGGTGQWVELDSQRLQAALPFWAPIDIRRVVSSLRELGVLRVEQGSQADTQRFAIDDGPLEREQSPGHGQTSSTQNQGSTPQGLPVYSEPPSSTGAATLIPANWQPEPTWIKQCAQHNIPEDFLWAALPEFVNYWRDRAQARFSWGNAFYKHVLKLWREEQTRRGAFEQAGEMSLNWRPSEAALQILHNSGVNAHFIEDAIPEFVLYWQERGTSPTGPWNTKFIEHVRRQWARCQAMDGFDDTPRPIPANWSPTAEFYETLQLAEIDADFANARVAEFVLYWRDSQQARASWNSTFLQFVKAEWARQAHTGRDILKANGGNNAEYRRGLGSGTNSVEELLQQLGDRSWAG